MSSVLLAGHDIEVDAEGFMLNPDQWTPEIATEIAREAKDDPDVFLDITGPDEAKRFIEAEFGFRPSR